MGLLGAGFLLPLLVYTAVGTQSRYAADDYCTAGILRTEGFIGAQGYWYTNFSPRYAFTFLVSVAELAGPWVATVLPGLAIAAWLAAGCWLLSELGWLRTLGPRMVLAEVVVFGTLSTTPDVGQSLFWQTGLLTYLLPLVLLTLLAAWIVRCARQRSGGLRLLPSLLLPFCAGGLSETYLSVQGGALGLALLAGLVSPGAPHAPAARPHLLAGLGGTLLAIVVEQVSPSVVDRQRDLQPPLVLAVEAALRVGGLFALRWAAYGLPILAACVLAPLLLRAAGAANGSRPPTAARRHLLVMGSMAALLVPAAFLPAFFALGGDPPARALIVPTYALIAFGAYAGVRLPTRLPRVEPAVLAGLVAVVPLVVALQTMPRVASAAQYAAAWDRLDSQIRTARAAGATELVVPPLPRNLGERYVATDPGDWFNVCVARYYGLATIAAASEPPDST